MQCMLILLYIFLPFDSITDREHMARYAERRHVEVSFVICFNQQSSPYVDSIKNCKILITH